MAHTSSNVRSCCGVASGSELILWTAVRRFMNTPQPARASHQMLKYAWMHIISARIAPPTGMVAKFCQVARYSWCVCVCAKTVASFVLFFFINFS